MGANKVFLIKLLNISGNEYSLVSEVGGFKKWRSSSPPAPPPLPDSLPLGVIDLD